MTGGRTSTLPAWDAVVLAGGGGRRLGGVDKPAVAVGGTTLLDRVLAALGGVGRTVVVGPPRPTSRDVAWTREQPPGAGPAAALAAGLALVSAPAVVVLAADLPFLDTETVRALRTAAGGADGALLVDHEGREQLLAGCWRTTSLRAAVERAGDLTDRPLRAVLGGLDRRPVRVLRDGPAPWWDCDTPDDLRRAREHA
ncbi:MAG TPA: NTP transferase domain-containing protein [Mycobacteriales bacterium]|nr:NTP transferase domain-containing protein [Mycobacteriales bacterium]